MNILVIGNGFDLAHGLKTNYKDFLRFIRCFLQHYSRKEVDKRYEVDESDVAYVKWVLDTFKEADHNDVYKDLISELYSLIAGNIWIDFFSDLQDLGGGWIDFEKEISRIIQLLDKMRKPLGTRIDEKSEILMDLAHHSMKISRHVDPNGVSSMDEKDTAELTSRLLTDLSRLTRALELYLSYYVEDEQLYYKIPPLPTIVGMKVDRVISFNYTDTFERIYGEIHSDVLYDYIHGKAKKGYGPETCNMVIGIDEYLCESEKNERNDFIEFKKFYQRIFKKTGCHYKTWLGTLNHANELTPNSKPQKVHVYFFGHSLDITDKDIIAELILQKNATTTIFYHNREAFSKQIINLVKVIGEEELIARTGDYETSIIFQPIDPQNDFDIANNAC